MVIITLYIYFAGHNLMFKTKRERRLKWEAEQAAKARNEAQASDTNNHGNDNNKDDRPNNHKCQQETENITNAGEVTCRDVTDCHSDRTMTEGKHGNQDSGNKQQSVCLKKDESMECNYDSQKGSDDEQKMDHDGRENTISTDEQLTRVENCVT